MERIKEILIIALIGSGALFWLIVLVGYYVPSQKVYNCDLAEISPDYPREVVDQCRRLRIGKSIST